MGQEELLTGREEVGDGRAEGESAMGDGGQAAISLMPDIDECMFSPLKAHNLKICMQGTYCIFFFFFLVMKRRGKENPNSLSILHLTYVTKENEVKVVFLEMQDLLYLATLRPRRDGWEIRSHWFCLLFPLLSCSHGCCR